MPLFHFLLSLMLMIISFLSRFIFSIILFRDAFHAADADADAFLLRHFAAAFAYFCH